MHAQPGTVGYPEPSETTDIEFVVTFRLPKALTDSFLEGTTVEDFRSALVGDIATILDHDFSMTLKPDYRPEVGVR